MRRFAQVAAAAVVMLAAVQAEAQLPTVQQVYDKYASAIGGRTAWKPVVGRSEKGTADITFAGISGAYERHSALPNKMRMIIDLGMLKIDQGFDGEKGWADQGQGPQRLPAEQEKNMAEASADGASFLDPSRFVKAEVVAKEAFNGSESYKVAVTTKSGQEAFEFFDATTGLRIGAIAKTPMGEQKTAFLDYKAFEGKLIATKVVQTTPQGDVVLNIQIVTFGTPDATYFKSPLDGK
ncbi:hypothetical protein [Gemmatimonas phototrophica]|uniref:Outer membrane lipoprotein-sorting protein n=1 Tax=Gemmatimonas phototrophica TaxID=1379270 RepID=A0A143BJC0_9BACT|nr:hypothetical protein [Gemmatimonas phototrophica]AMW05156.1 hypothetical protein GEMMAAP_10665 [Gemmatimonas phototrophica]